MKPTWTYHAESIYRGPILEPGPDSTVSPRILLGEPRPDVYASEDLRLVVELQDAYTEGISIFRWGPKGEEVFVCYAGASLDHRDVVRRLSEVRPQPSKPKEWEAAIKQAVTNGKHP